MRNRDRRLRRNGESSRIFYYVTCVYEGRRQLVGPYKDEWSAQQAGAEKFPVDFQVIPMTTSDLSEASRRLKGRLIDKFGLSEAVKRLKHRE